MTKAYTMYFSRKKMIFLMGRKKAIEIDPTIRSNFQVKVFFCVKMIHLTIENVGSGKKSSQHFQFRTIIIS